MSQRNLLVVANWKMNGLFANIRPLVSQISQGLADRCIAEVAICPPYVYLAELAASLPDTVLVLGAQDVSCRRFGAFTGEIAAEMLQDFSCRYVIVGHSERRILCAESDAVVAEKFVRVQDVGLMPILCVGEQMEARSAGNTEAVLARQLDAVLDLAGIDAFSRAVIAYEPVWAIGSGVAATPEQVQQVHIFIRSLLARHNKAIADGVRIIYGGSVKATNAEQIFAMADVDGGLIGGASLEADEFLNICHAVRG